ncbi:MAG: hypothetical protein HYU53_06180 [Acidobacteria bacterium]|nr:hypothetical protein [Acidobacteriota bacterium]
MSARTVSAAWLICAAVAVLPAAPRPAARRPFDRTVLGASLFRAAWAYRHDRAWLESQLDYLSLHGFDAIRAFGVVGDPSRPDYWDGREIDWKWEDYDSVVAGLTDLAYDEYGIRVQWTIFAGGRFPAAADRAGVVDRFIRMSRGREQKILAFEIANEHLQNGFDGPEGLEQVRRFARTVRAATSVPVAASAHRPELCPLYAAGDVDFATVHFDREAPHARWSPLLEPWQSARRKGHLSSCDLPEVASNNEPSGPGASVKSTSDPLSIVMAAVNTYLAGIPIYMFHSGPGVRDDPAHDQGLRPSGLEELPGADALFAGLAEMRRYLPGDVFEWTPMPANEPGFPFDVEGPVAVMLGARRGAAFIVALSGIESEVTLVARRSASVRALDPLTGKAFDQQTLRRGERWPLHAVAAVVLASTPASATVQ